MENEDTELPRVTLRVAGEGAVESEREGQSQIQRHSEEPTIRQLPFKRGGVSASARRSASTDARIHGHHRTRHACPSRYAHFRGTS